MARKLESDVNRSTRVKVREPQMYNVIMYNDDFTPMDFVVEILMSIFHKKEQDAFRLMYAVHRGSKAVAGTYVFDIAETKKTEAIKRARKEGYPFRLETEPVGKE